MKRFLGAVLGTILMFGLNQAARADDKDATAILDKAIKALGGEEKLTKAKASEWKAKGKMTINGNEGDITVALTSEGLENMRQEFVADFAGNKVEGVTVVAGDKGWRKFMDTTMELDKNALANQKRALYLLVVPITLVQLKGKDFKVEAAGEEKIGDKPAVKLKVTAPDGKDFTLFIDKESSLPVKMVAKVIGFGGEEVTQETTYSGYKEFNGIKKATKLENKRDGEKFQDLEISEFKVLEKVDAKTFTEPK